MKLKKIQFTPKQKRILGINQVYILRFEKPIFLEETENKSIELLREIFKPYPTQEKKREFKEFLDIIHKHYLKNKKKIEKIEKKKKEYYKQLRIKERENKIKRLKEEIKKLENERKQI